MKLQSEAQQPDNRYPPQFATIAGTPRQPPQPAPQPAPPPVAPPAQTAQVEAQPRSQIPGTPTQPQVPLGEERARQYDRDALRYEEAARRAGIVPGGQTQAEAYRAAAQQAAAKATAIRQGIIATQQKQGESNVELEKGIFEEGRKGYRGAQEIDTQLDTIDRSIKTLGPDGLTGMGAGATNRLGLARQYNTLIGFIPEDIRKEFNVTPFGKDELAGWEAFNKASQKLGFALAKQLGSREAMQIVQAAVASVPNVEQTYWGARLVSAGMRQAAQRDKDYFQYIVNLKRNGQSTLDADVTFNRTHPVSAYTAKAASVVPPENAINFLRANPTPQNIRQFNAKYGDGASIGVFGTGRQ
jgi:hypothetical protein